MTTKGALDKYNGFVKERNAKASGVKLSFFTDEMQKRGFAKAVVAEAGFYRLKTCFTGVKGAHGDC
jgi:hypothetical protein